MSVMIHDGKTMSGGVRVFVEDVVTSVIDRSSSIALIVSR
jgi:hypothetical protein